MLQILIVHVLFELYLVTTLPSAPTFQMIQPSVICYIILMLLCSSDASGDDALCQDRSRED